MSIRLRLTLLYSAILALTLIAFSLALYLTLSRAMLRSIDGALIDERKRLVVNARKDWRTGAIELPASKVTAPDTLVQLRAMNGNEIVKSANFRDANFDLPLSDAGLRAIRDNQAWTETTLLDGQRFRVQSGVVQTSDNDALILQVARSLAEQDKSLGDLVRILITGSGIVTVIAFGIGWILAGAALRPINRITHTAQAIGADRDFERRVQYTGPNDEIGRLATTFNTMLSALQEAYKQTAQALQAQRRFVADASHELRTPLTTIRGNIGLLQRDPPIRDEDRIAVLADMVDESERMSRLVNDLLMLARADAGRPLRMETVPVKALIEDACRKANTFGAGQIVRCEPIPDVAVQADPDAVKQVLLILLDNALKFTPPPGTITMSAAEQDGAVAISVADTGAGIAPDVLPHIFERFFRGDTARTGSGAGLGLAIARTLVEAQRGTIAVVSTPGEGSVFTVRWPQTPYLSTATEAAALAATH